MQVKVSYITANDIMEVLGVGRSKAYSIVRELNQELEESGYNVIRGKVPIRYFQKKVLWLRIGVRDEYFSAGKEIRDRKAGCRTVRIEGKQKWDGVLSFSSGPSSQYESGSGILLLCLRGKGRCNHVYGQIIWNVSL